MLGMLRRLEGRLWALVLVLMVAVVGQVYFDLALPEFSGKFVDQLIQAAAGRLALSSGQLVTLGLQMLGCAVASMACTIVCGFVAAFLSSSMGRKLRQDVFGRVMSFGMAETNHFSTPSLITRSTNDIQQIQMTMMMLFRFAVSAPVTAIWAVLRISSVNRELTIVAALWIALLVIFISVMFWLVLPKFRSVQTLTDRLNAVARENLSGLRVVKAYNADEYEQQRFDQVSRSLAHTQLYINRAMGAFMPVMLFVMSGMTLTIYWLGAHLLNTTDSINAGTIVEFAGLAMQVLFAFMMLTMLFIMAPRAQVSANRINQVLATPQSILDPADPKPLPPTQLGGRSVEFRGVTFGYPGAQSMTLTDISFCVEAGQTIALIGSTGSGKSTLVNLLPRFYDVTQGQILLDGVDIRDLAQRDLRSQIGYVPQRGVLFAGTVAQNIGYGVDNLGHEQMVAAARIAMADEFVSQMPDGYESHIAQGGRNVSGGQRQRLSIARAVAISPKVLIFDDSFSALDYATDRAVRANLRREMADTTMMIVAQRIGTIMDADVIIVLDQGQMVGQGTHSQLVRECPVYRQIALSQLTPAELGLTEEEAR